MKIKMINDKSTAAEVIVGALVALHDKHKGEPIISLSLYDGNIAITASANISVEGEPETKTIAVPAPLLLEELGCDLDMIIKAGVSKLMLVLLGMNPGGEKGDEVRLFSIYDPSEGDEEKRS